MKKFILALFLMLSICSSAHAITFTKEVVGIERSSIKYIYTGKTFFFGYFVIIESYQPGKFNQLTADLASWRNIRSLNKDGSPLDVLSNGIMLDSGYITGWQNDGKYDIVTAPITNMSLIEQNDAVSKVVSLMPECKVFRSGRNYIDYKCN